jgi:hypothetical protein
LFELVVLLGRGERSKELEFLVLCPRVVNPGPAGAGRPPIAAEVRELVLRLELADDCLYPQCRFSSASRRISSRSERSSGGRPGGRCEYVQRRATSSRC